MLTESTRRRRKPVSYEEISDADDLDFQDRPTRRGPRRRHHEEPLAESPTVPLAEDDLDDIDTDSLLSEAEAAVARAKGKSKLKRSGSTSSVGRGKPGKPRKSVASVPVKGKPGVRKMKNKTDDEEGEEGEGKAVEAQEWQQMTEENEVLDDKTSKKKKAPVAGKKTPTAGAMGTGKTPKKSKAGNNSVTPDVKKGDAKTVAIKVKGIGGEDATQKKKKSAKSLYDPRAVTKLAAENPDAYWTFHATSGHGMIDSINSDNPLEVIPVDVSDQGPIISMTLSPDGTLLATFCTSGSAKIWDACTDFRLLRKLRDGAEADIDEFYCGRFAPDQTHLLVGGKLKDRRRWSAEDDDNHILPCPLKIFNVDTGVVVSTLRGHSEEILCVKALQFRGDNYYISTSQDGYIFKWRMADDWTTLLSSTRMEDGITCMAFTVSFVPDTGNKYFIAACDEHLRLYDFEDAVLLQTFEDMYSSYCDCGKFIRWSDADTFTSSTSLSLGGDGDDKENEEEVDVERVEEERKHNGRGQRKKGVQGAKMAYFVSRGVELCDLDEGLLPSAPNTCTLHRLVYPDKKGAPFRLEEVRRYKHADYFANSWLVKIASNGRYILAPTPYGQVFAYNMSTGEVAAILKDHQDLEVRDVLFHPYSPLLFTCGDDGTVKIYTYASADVDAPGRVRDDVERIVAGAKALVVESDAEDDDREREEEMEGEGEEGEEGEGEVAGEEERVEGREGEEEDEKMEIDERVVMVGN